MFKLSNKNFLCLKPCVTVSNPGNSTLENFFTKVAPKYFDMISEYVSVSSVNEYLY